MKRPFAASIGIVVGLLACWGAFAASTPQQFALPGHGTLLLNVPAGWQSNEKQLQGGSPAIQFGPSSGASFAVLITAVLGHGRKRRSSGRCPHPIGSGLRSQRRRAPLR